MVTLFALNVKLTYFSDTDAVKNDKELKTKPESTESISVLKSTASYQKQTKRHSGERRLIMNGHLSNLFFESEKSQKNLVETSVRNIKTPPSTFQN